MNTLTTTPMEEKYIRSSLKMLKHMENHPTTRTSEIHYYFALINLMREKRQIERKNPPQQDSFRNILIFLTSLFSVKDDVQEYKEYQHLSQDERTILFEQVSPLITL